MGFLSKIKNAVVDRAGNEAAKKIRGDQSPVSQSYPSYSPPPQAPPEPKYDPEFEARKAAHEREMEEQSMALQKQAMQFSSQMMQSQVKLMEESTKALENYNKENEKK